MPLSRRLRRPHARSGLTATLAGLLLSTAACRASGEERGSAATPGTAAGAAAAAGAGDSTAVRAIADTARILGSPQAKVWMLIVSDFQCPFCKRWHDETFETLRREYVETGKVRVAYLHFPLDQHEQALPTAEAAMCAGAQGKFWPYQTALFESAERWGRPGSQSAVYDSLASAVGADPARFRACTGSRVMRALVEADRDRMVRAGVQSTPSFFVGSTPLSGAQPLDAFRRAIDAELARAAR
jgi:protein-disulfide isomerase